MVTGKTEARAEHKFPLGRLVSTIAVHRLIAAGLLDEVPALLARHASGDWGDLCAEDKRLNNQALKDGSRILSAYKTEGSPDGKVYIITEADRSVTTVLLPSDY